MGLEVSGLLGIIFLVIAIWAIAKIINSGTTTGKKILWILFILFLPVVGLIVWFLMGPKG
ncbi:PLDc N-terminal domain-containing protein [Granulosicoccus antarcticus]|uniref:Cardiolipin synthase N-terminal domain-containing protein n=1 Tax=Granulosicoccus antarcticus IMCC3135 TaxID=1192854 RepID=A0A2Z2NJJ8_9GAMM|nr:PLDc N-terminal domain-containing protein [Granulosicoccus antarcticus]ASJ71349.1 hypothetical protein IMCC3135_06210 [Granulosicoccus antarcticus IMCC3135]